MTKSSATSFSPADRAAAREELGSLLPVQPRQIDLHRLLVGIAGVWVLLRVELDV